MAVSLALGRTYLAIATSRLALQQAGHKRADFIICLGNCPRIYGYLDTGTSRLTERPAPLNTASTGSA